MHWTQDVLNQRLLASARTLDVGGIELWLKRGGDAKFHSSQALVLTIGFGAPDCCKLLFPHSDIEVVARQFLEGEVGFEPEEVASTLDWFALQLPFELQQKWIQVFEGLCPQTLAWIEKQSLSESLPTVSTLLPSHRI